MERTKIKQYETITDWARAQATVITYPIARVLEKLGLHPNTVTIVGFVLNVAVGGLMAAGHPQLGGLLLLFASSTDALDGALARVAGTKSRFGAFLDSTLDRISEGALFLGLLAWLLPQGRYIEVYLVALTLLGSVMVSYSRARAEGVGYACKVGLFTRMERILVLGTGMMLGWVRPTLIVLAVFVWITVLQRILYVYKSSRRDP